MGTISRREFFEKTAAGAAVAGVLAANVKALRANPLGLPIGSQTYPHRQMIADGKFMELMMQLKGIGVDQIELCGYLGGTGYPEFKALADAKQTRKIIEDHGLKAVSCHFMFPELRDNLQKAIDWSKELGLEQIMVPTMKSGATTTTMDEVKTLVGQFTKMAEAITKAGMRAGSHNEAFDLVKLDGKFVYDTVIEMTDPKLIGFQFQMSTINVGMVAADYFRKYPGRFFSMHIQDIDTRQPRSPIVGGRGGSHPQAAVGKGTIDWKATFEAAKVGGVKNFFIEQNMELTKESVAALKQMT